MGTLSVLRLAAHVVSALTCLITHTRAFAESKSQHVEYFLPINASYYKPWILIFSPSIYGPSGNSRKIKNKNNRSSVFLSGSCFSHVVKPRTPE